MENTKVILIAMVLSLVAVRLFKKMKEKNNPAGSSQAGKEPPKKNKISSIPDDYEPYSGR
jgi:hypothetical protein